jgi:hypothetical protein
MKSQSNKVFAYVNTIGRLTYFRLEGLKRVVLTLDEAMRLMDECGHVFVMLPSAT